MIVVDLPDETATAALAVRISALAHPADVIALKGDLGTGKTTLRAPSFARAELTPRVPFLLPPHTARSER